MSIFARFGQIFWGLLLVILDLRINGFDVLPDFIGSILVAVGCAGLEALSRRFAVAKTLSWILMALSLIGLIVPNELSSLFALLRLAIDCAMMWFLLGGIMEFASARQRPDLSGRASNRRVAYIVLMCLATGIGMMAGPHEAAEIGVILVLCILILLVLILHLIHRVRYDLVGSDH